MKKRTVRVLVEYRSMPDETKVARVAPMSLGPFPMGTREVEATGETWDAVDAELRLAVKKLLPGCRIVFEGRPPAAPGPNEKAER